VASCRWRKSGLRGLDGTRRTDGTVDHHRPREENLVTVHAGYVRRLFANLERGESDAFFECVADDVDWTVMGTHPLAGNYRTKSGFLAHTFARLDKILKEGVVLRVTNVLVDGDGAAVEMESLSTALDGKPFDNRYCWIVRFSKGTIVEVRAYLDSALVQRLIDENEPSAGQREQQNIG
jgi:ketosteroid isomerase-like protein